MAIFRQPSFQFGQLLLQLTDLFSQDRILRHIPQQLADLLSQPRIFRFQSGYAFFCSHGLILAAYAIPYLSSYQKTRGYRATDVHLYLAALLGALESPPPLFRTPACHRQGFPIIFLFIEDHSDVKICLVA